jgi:hypothetical protein
VSILAITPYAGSEKLVRMTERMLMAFDGCPTMAEDVIATVAVNNAAVRPVNHPLTWHAHMDKNEGFGVAVNLAIKREIFDMKKSGFPTTHTHVLVLNNDLEFPEPSWLMSLLRHREGNLVLSPCTDITATKVAVAESSRDLDPVRWDQVSAFCWLVPVTTIEMIRKKFGFELFSPEFSNYGSDDVTGAVLRRLVGHKPFKVVPRSFVKHKKAQTANELGVKGGTKELLQRIANWKRMRRLA